MSRKKGDRKKIGHLKAAGGPRLHIPCEIEPENNDLKKPIFSFRFMEYGGKNCLTVFDNACKAAVADTMVQLSQIEWKQIISTRRQALGYEKIPRKRFLVRIPPIVTEDIERLEVFRFSQPGRIAGFRRNEIFHIVLVSPVHALYK